MIRAARCIMVFAGLVAGITAARTAHAQVSATSSEAATPLVIGETFTMKSGVLGEVRRINVWAPPVYADSPLVRLPVMYMPDGGTAEDFIHVAGLMQVSIGNGTMRPFLLVGIENTERRRDMTGPTDNPEDRKIAKRVSGSAAFRTFIRTELIPTVQQRYRTTAERAIVGESLAGLFVVETMLLDPTLFDTYIAIDPSLWWNNATLVKRADELLARRPQGAKTTLYITNSSEEGIAGDVKKFTAALKSKSHPGLAWYFEPLPHESHGTIYHPAALNAFRKLFAPQHAGER